MDIKKINILVVDDDCDDRRLVELFLKKSSQSVEFTVSAAATIAQALEILKAGFFDVMLLDLQLPDSNGIQTVQKARSASAGVPIVVLTGLADEETGLEAIRNGADDYLIKGQSLQYTLVRAVRYAIERKQTERLKEVVKVKSDFLSTVSHELRTPLTCMKESIDIILGGLVGEINSQQRKFLNITTRNIDRLSRLIDNVLHFQKLEAGKMKLHMAPNDMNEVIRDVKETMAPLADEKGITLDIRLDETIPAADFDKDKITQVLMNLTDNAIKFTHKGGIVIESYQRDGSVCVYVKDTGLGIRKESLPRLFCEFEQLSDPKEGKIGGSGLGLAISRKIVEEHNGRIWPESEFNKGTTFYFELPFQQKRNPAAAGKS